MAAFSQKEEKGSKQRFLKWRRANMAAVPRKEGERSMSEETALSEGAPIWPLSQKNKK